MVYMIDITLLKPHPRNTEIYGQEDVKALADKIKESSWINPLLVTQGNVVISGHRRYQACLLLDKKEIPVTYIEFSSENEELERLLLENEYREKTTYQKMQEGKIWEEIYKIKAREKMSLGAKGKENFPTLEKGQTRDLVADKIKIGSGKTYETAKKVTNEIERLGKEGNKKEAEFLKATLNQSVNSAKVLVNTDLTKVDETLKDKVINKEITAKEAVKEIKRVVEDKEEGKENFPTLDIKKSQNSEDIYIENVSESVNDTNENINSIDEKSITMEVCCNVDSYKNIMSKYVQLEEHFEDMSKENKNMIKEHIEEMQNIIDKIKGFLF